MQRMWYNAEELSQIRYEDRRQASEILSSGREVSLYCDDFCMDGLESETESLRRKASYQEALLAVLTEQECLWDEEMEDPDVIAEVCMECTEHCKEAALERANKLAEAVKLIHSPSAPKKIEMSFERRRRPTLKDLFSATFTLDSSSPRERSLLLVNEAINVVQNCQ